MLFCIYAKIRCKCLSNIDLVIEKIHLFLPFLKGDERLKRLFLASETESLNIVAFQL